MYKVNSYIGEDCVIKQTYKSLAWAIKEFRKRTEAGVYSYVELCEEIDDKNRIITRFEDIPF